MASNKTNFIFDRNQKAIYDGTAPILHPAYLIPMDEYAKLTEPKDDWEEKYLVGNKLNWKIRNSIDVENMDASRKNYEPKMSAFVMAYVKFNPKIPVEAKIAMYIHIGSHSRKKMVKPNSVPLIFKVNSNVSLVVELFYKDSEANTGHAKPHIGDVCQMYIFIIEKDKDGKDILPKTLEDYHYAGDSSDYHISLPFNIKDGGKEAYVLPCWKNNEGKGDFGTRTSVTIPR